MFAALLWFRRRQRKRRSVGFLFLTPGPGQAPMSQAIDLQTDYAGPRAVPFSSALSLPSITHIGRGRFHSTDGPDGSPYKPLSRASTQRSPLHLGSQENDLSIDSPHPENPFADPPHPKNPFADPPLTQKMIDSLLVQNRLK